MFRIICLLCTLVSAVPGNLIADENTGEIMPAANFGINFCNFPHAWTVTTGENVRIAIVDTREEGEADWVALTQTRAPGATIFRIDPELYLGYSAGQVNADIILLLFQPEPSQYDEMLKRIDANLKNGMTVVIPAYFGTPENTEQLARWQDFVAQASKAGAVISGIHGNAYQIGGLALWETIPVDVFVVDPRIGGDNSFAPDAILPVAYESSAFYTAAAVALLKSSAITLSPAEIKELIHSRSRNVLWAHVKVEWQPGRPWERVTAFENEAAKDKFVEQTAGKNGQLIATFANRSLDAALLLGLEPMEAGQWAVDAMHAPEAQKFATGKGITVAVLDHLFDTDDPAILEKYVSPGSIFEDAPVFEAGGNPGHGVWMINDLLHVAPDVKIMPVRIYKSGITNRAECYAKGIEYALANGADVISLSHQAVAEENYPILDAAIEKATGAGVPFVYIHYYGKRGDVILTGMVEFARNNSDFARVYTVGTNFHHGFPYTWGMSPTAPLVAGVVAMLKEINPDLTVQEIKSILLESGRPIGDGVELLDAAKAVAKVSVK